MRTFLAACVIFLANQAGAQPVRTAQDIQLCAIFGSMAEEIMKQRQAGVAMSTLLVAVNKSQNSLTPFAVEVVELAFERPRHLTEPMQAASVMDFRNEIEKECFSLE